MSPREPIRVLQVLGALNPGGVESWLLQVLRHVDPKRCRIDFLVHTEAPAAYDEEIRALGARIFACPQPRRPWRYGPRLQRILNEFGPYDVVHSHVHDFSGYVLRIARRAGVPVRIAHSHCDLSDVERQSPLWRRRYLALMKGWIRKHATVGLGCSRRAAESLFGREWERDPRYRLLFCGIDLSPFSETAPQSQLRAEFGIPNHAFVVGHVGRFAHQKNHRFLIETAVELVRRRPESWFVLVGDGPLRPEIERQAREAGIGEHVIFAGLRRDVPRMMTDLFDAFLLPSHFEGLPIVLLEAQAAGLPCLFSDVVDADTVVVPGLMTSESLSASAEQWAERLASFAGRRRTPSTGDSLTVLSESPFNILRCVEQLLQLYECERKLAYRGNLAHAQLKTAGSLSS